MQNQIKEIFNFDKIKRIVNEFESQLEELIEKKDYLELLKVCPLKNQIVHKLGDKFLIDNYEKMAKLKISNEPKLQEKLREKYFNGFFSDI